MNSGHLGVDTGIPGEPIFFHELRASVPGPAVCKEVCKGIQRNICIFSLSWDPHKMEGSLLRPGQSWPHLEAFRAYSQLCTHGLLLMMLRRPFRVQRFEPRSAKCKAIVLPAVLAHNLVVFFFDLEYCIEPYISVTMEPVLNKIKLLVKHVHSSVFICFEQ